jgi:hypothetical protein
MKKQRINSWVHLQQTLTDITQMSNFVQKSLEAVSQGKDICC